MATYSSILTWRIPGTEEPGRQCLLLLLSHFSHVRFFATPWTPEGSIRLLCPWNSPGKNIGVGCHALLQGIFLTQESNPSVLRLLHFRLILYY